MSTFGTYGEVVPEKLYLGSVFAIEQFANNNLESREITVISVLHHAKLIALAVQQVQTLRTQRGVTVHHIHWNLPDKNQATLVCDKLEEMLNSIDHSKQCLVHCALGASRSAAICAAYLISRHDYSLEQALDHLRSIRPSVQPNLGFIASLRALEQCDGQISQAVKRLQSSTVAAV